LLNNGMVLVAGGSDSSGNPYTSAELYDPASGNFTLVRDLSTARYAHIATLLPNGMVLLTGGASSSAALASSELY
jgi:hypothetical protein